MPDLVGTVAFAEAAGLLRRAVQSGRSAGRPLFAANLDLPWPEPSHLALWHAATLAREHRGDGHVAALVANDVGPCESHVLRLAVEGISPESLRPYRGWTEDDWASAVDRLQVRGLLDGEGRPSAAGYALHDTVEFATDAAGLDILDCMTPDEARRLVLGLRTITREVINAEVVPYPNPIGVPRPDDG
jgi:hypothetical protein